MGGPPGGVRFGPPMRAAPVNVDPIVCERVPLAQDHTRAMRLGLTAHRARRKNSGGQSRKHILSSTDNSAVRNWASEDWKTCAMPAQTHSVTSTPAALAR